MADPDDIDILGTWRLVALEEWYGEKLIDPFLMGRNPNGLLHYLPGNRVAVLIARGDRKKMATGYREAAVEALAEAARSFTAYAGSYSREGHKITHHIEINSYENDVGADYIRYFSLEDGLLVLTSPSYGKENTGSFTRVIWRRIEN